MLKKGCLELGGLNKMPKLKFFDIKGKRSFETDQFEVVEKSGRRFAVATAPSGIKAHRIVAKDFRR